MPFMHITEDDGSTTVQSLTSGHTFQMPRLDDGVLAEDFHGSFHGSVDAFGELIDKGQAIEKDTLLSREGKDAKLEPLRAKTIDSLAKIAGAVSRLETQNNEREAKLLAVPALDSTSSVLQLEDREIRDWLRSMSTSERLATLQRAKDDPDGGGRLMLAMLRSPIPMLDVEKGMAKDLWAERKRADNPAEAFAIDSRRASAEWTRRGLAYVHAQASVTIGWPRDRVLEHIASSSNEMVQEGAGLFGFDKADLARGREIARLRKVRGGA